MKPQDKTIYLLYGFFVLALVANIAFWTSSKKLLPTWGNVPPVPSKASVSSSALGDDEIAYRLVGYFLQNSGNVGGHYEALKDYDYAELRKWFALSEQLDVRSNYVPFLAAYYYGALEDPAQKLDDVIDYLAEHGQQPYPQKWRWLAHAVYLSKYKQNNAPKALEYAKTLSALKTDVAPWGRQMVAFVQLDMGNKEAAYEFMVRLLASEKDKVHPNEVNEMVRFICTRALEPAQALKNPLCQKK